MPSIPPLELGDLSMSSTNPGEAQSTSVEKTEPLEGQTTSGAETSLQESKKEERAEVAEPLEEAQSDKAGPLPAPINTSLPAMTRQNSEAIGPSTDLPTPMLQPPQSTLAAGPVIQFTLLLASTGTRHPFQLNERYLTKRNVTAKGEDGAFDPSTISVYNLKELILKDWRDGNCPPSAWFYSTLTSSEDWDQKPSSPSAIRLIFFGQLLADNVSLKGKSHRSSRWLELTRYRMQVAD